LGLLFPRGAAALFWSFRDTIEKLAHALSAVFTRRADLSNQVID